MKDGRSHQSNQCREELFAFQLGSGQHRLQRRVAFRTPFRAKPVRHFAMNDRAAQGSFADIVGRRHARIMQKRQELGAVRRAARLQAHGPLSRHVPRQQVVQFVVQEWRQADKFGQGYFRHQAIILMMQVDGALPQRPRGLRPGRLGRGVQHPRCKSRN